MSGTTSCTTTYSTTSLRLADNLSSAYTGTTMSDALRLRRNQWERARYARHQDSINHRRRSTHAATQQRRRESLIAARRSRFNSAVFDIAEEDISHLQDVMSQRQQALDAARESTGVNIKIAEPCAHCGARLFAKESRGMCCKNGKGILPRLPALPQALENLYSSSEPSAKKFRKESRAYNCKCNFASLNVEDGELKKMFGDHLLSVQGR